MRAGALARAPHALLAYKDFRSLNLSMKLPPIALALFLAGSLFPPLCMAQPHSFVPGASVTKPGYYRNEFFGFSLVFPSAWTVVQQRKPNLFQKQGGDALVRDEVLSREQVAADQSNTHSFLGIANPRKEKNGWNPQILIVAEGIHEGAPFKNAQEYLAHTLKLFDAVRSPKTTIETPPHEVTLGNRKFWRAELSRVDVRQYYYATICKNFALSVIVTAGSSEQLVEADNIAKRVSFSEDE